MSLPNDIARCLGKPWPGFGVQPECIDCLRKTDQQPDRWYSFTEPPAETPCPLRRVNCKVGAS